MSFKQGSLLAAFTKMIGNPPEMGEENDRL